MEAINYMQVIEQTDEEKLVMFMKCSKKELAKMLIESNKHLRPMGASYFPIEDEVIWLKGVSGGYRSFK